MMETTQWMAFAMGDRPGGAIAWLIPIAVGIAYGTGVMALVFAAVPPLGRWLAPRPRTNSFEHFVTFTKVRKDGVIETRDGWLIGVWRLEGTDHAALPDSDLDTLYRMRCRTLDQIASVSAAKLELRLITVRERVPGRAKKNEGPESNITRSLRVMSERWDNSIVGRTYRNRCYIVVYVRKGSDGEAALTAVHDVVRGGLSRYKPKRLAGTGEDSPLALYGRVLAPVSRPQPNGLDAPDDVGRLVATDTMAWYPDGRMRASSGPHESWMACLALRLIPKAGNEQMVLDILACEHELTIVTAVVPLNKTIEKARLYRDMSSARSLAEQLGLPGGGGDQLAEAYAVLDGTHPSGEQAEIYRWQMTVLAYAPSVKDLEDVIDHVRANCTKHGASLVREGLVAENAFWHTLPGHGTFARPWEIMTWPVAALWLPQSAGEGIGAHDWAPHEITTFRSIQGGGFRFTFHPVGNEVKDPLGHCVVIAPPGAGKTTLLCHLAGQTLRVPGTRIWFCDRFDGARIFTGAVGGTYVNTAGGAGEEGDGSTVAMNPLKLDDSARNRQFIRRWISALAPGKHTPEDETAIERLVELNYDYAEPERQRLDLLADAAFGPTSEAGKAIKQWCAGAGRMFMCAEDSVSAMSERWIAIDCKNALEDEKIAGPFVHYLIHQIQEQSRKRGDPSLIIIDETGPMLANESFKAAFQVALLEGRKLHQVVVSCFQVPTAIEELKIGTLIRTACPTIIFLPNPKAQEDEYAHFNLNENELDFVLGRRGNIMTHAALLKRYDSPHTAIIDTSLAPLKEYLGVFDDNPGIIARIKADAERNTMTAAVEAHIERLRLEHYS